MTNSITKKFLAILFFVSPLFASEWGEANKNIENQLFTVQVLDSEAFIIKDSIEFSSTTEAHQRIEVKSEIMTTVEEVLRKAGPKYIHYAFPSKCFSCEKESKKPYYEGPTKCFSCD